MMQRFSWQQPKRTERIWFKRFSNLVSDDMWPRSAWWLSTRYNFLRLAIVARMFRVERSIEWSTAKLIVFKFIQQLLSIGSWTNIPYNMAAGIDWWICDDSWFKRFSFHELRIWVGCVLKLIVSCAGELNNIIRSYENGLGWSFPSDLSFDYGRSIFGCADRVVVVVSRLFLIFPLARSREGEITPDLVLCLRIRRC